MSIFALPEDVVVHQTCASTPCSAKVLPAALSLKENYLYLRVIEVGMSLFSSDTVLDPNDDSPTMDEFRDGEYVDTFPLAEITIQNGRESPQIDPAHTFSMYPDTESEGLLVLTVMDTGKVSGPAVPEDDPEHQVVGSVERVGDGEASETAEVLSVLVQKMLGIELHHGGVAGAGECRGRAEYADLVDSLERLAEEMAEEGIDVDV